MLRPGRKRRGFALLAVLWVVTIASVAAMTAQIMAREAVTAASNRVQLARAAWNAEDCLERSRAVVNEALERYEAGESAVDPWLALDTVVALSRTLEQQSCVVTFVPSGLAVDLNRASREQLVALFVAARRSESVADSMADALLDWRDADDVARPFGAEGAWYRTRGHRIRNGPLAHVRELASIRGLAEIGGLDSQVGVDVGRVSLRHAPAAVLASLPGFSSDVVEQVIEARQHSVAALELNAITAAVSGTARDSLLTHFPQLVQMTSSIPEFWTIRSHAYGEDNRVEALVEMRIMRSGRRAAIVRRRGSG